MGKLGIMTTVLGMLGGAGCKFDVDGNAARALVKDGAKLVDVRTPSEYGGGHIEGAINIPLNELGGRMSELGDKAGPIVVYCRSGGRSGKAKQQLQAEGFSAVYNLGPMTAW